MDRYYVGLALAMYQNAIGDLIKSIQYMAMANEMESDMTHAEDTIETLRRRSRLMVAYMRDGVASKNDER